MPPSIRDPIHGSIGLDDWVIPLIDHPAFQRLRRVQQLGTAHLVYPGAHHKRFEHSLGAYHLAGLMAQGLDLEAQDALTLRAAALLHDVGHGPFSHAFEELSKEEGRRHEETTVDLVRWGPLADLLRQGDVDPVAVGDAVLGKGPLAAIVSGALDADRMDYLMRDAHYTGVRTSIDTDRLRRTARLDDEHGVVVRESGVLAAEGLLTTRFLLYPSVYFHHAVRASETMLLQAIRLHIQDGHSTLADLDRETDDGLLWRLRQGGGDAAELVQRLDGRRLHKRAFEGGPERFAEAAIQRLTEDPAHRARTATEIAEAAGVPPSAVIVDVPHPPRFRETHLMVRRRNGTTVPVTEASSLIRILHEARLDHWRFWVFTPKRHRRAVAEAARRILAPA